MNYEKVFTGSTVCSFKKLWIPPKTVAYVTGSKAGSDVFFFFFFIMCFTLLIYTH